MLFSVVVVVVAVLFFARCRGTWVNMRLDSQWTCRGIYHPGADERGNVLVFFLFVVFDTHASTAQAQVLITVEVLDHYVEEVQHEVQLQIRFPNSVAIAAECESFRAVDEA
jgi:hypothetical protein